MPFVILLFLLTHIENQEQCYESHIFELYENVESDRWQSVMVVLSRTRRVINQQHGMHAAGMYSLVHIQYWYLHNNVSIKDIA